MGAPTSLLQNARAFARDYARDQMPRGYLWDVVDYVPALIDASLTGRGAWRWGSGALLGDIEAGILATFTAGEQLLVQDDQGELFQIGQAPPFDAIYRGSIARAIQNPVQYLNNVVWFDGTGATVPKVVGPTGDGVPMDASAPKAKVGAVWQDYILAANQPGFEDTLYWSKPGAPSATWDVNSVWRTSLPVSGIAVLRSVILAFHAASVERIRGSVPPSTGVTDDLTMEPLFQRVGTPDARSIAYWNENVLFADEHGVHITDGAVTRNIASQGGISYYWRPLFQNRISLAACVFLDFYIITVRRSDGIADTLICDLNKREWFRFSNVPAMSYISSGGSTGMERVWAGLAGTHRLARIGPMFFPDLTTPTQVDDNGVPVLPEFETPWYRLAQEGRKRVRFFYLSYDVRAASVALEAHASAWRFALHDEEEPIPPPPVSVLAAIAPVLDVGFIHSPQETNYVSLGGLPPTTEYTRYRLPVNKFPYGVAFRVKQLAASSVTRIFDLAVEAQAAERSRV